MIELSKRSPRFAQSQTPWAPRLMIALLVAGYLLFAHGCHADEDTELLLRQSGDYRAIKPYKESQVSSRRIPW